MLPVIISLSIHERVRRETNSGERALRPELCWVTIWGVPLTSDLGGVFARREVCCPEFCTDMVVIMDVPTSEVFPAFSLEPYRRSSSRLLPCGGPMRYHPL